MRSLTNQTKLHNRTKFNHQIKASQLRVISETGEQIGVMKTSEALNLAGEHGLDLIEVSPNAQPPVAKLMDLAKFKYQQKKLQQQQKKKLKKTEVKTLWISVRISDHDMDIKAKKAAQFIEEGNLVKMELRMRGREKAHGDIGRERLKKFVSLIKQPHKIEVPIKRMGGTISVTIAPSK